MYMKLTFLPISSFKYLLYTSISPSKNLTLVENSFLKLLILPVRHKSTWTPSIHLALYHLAPRRLAKQYRFFCSSSFTLTKHLHPKMKEKWSKFDQLDLNKKHKSLVIQWCWLPTTLHLNGNILLNFLLKKIHNLFHFIFIASMRSPFRIY